MTDLHVYKWKIWPDWEIFNGTKIDCSHTMLYLLFGHAMDSFAEMCHWTSLCAMIESLVDWPGQVKHYCKMIHSHAWLGPPVQPYSGITGWGRRVAPYWVKY